MIKTQTSNAALEKYYEKTAEDYLHSLPLEHFMESTPQSTQRKITLESLDLVNVYRPNMHVFSELLVQYPMPRRKRPGQVCPDILVVIYDGPVTPIGSYDVPLQPAKPFWTLEFLSKSNKRKDYVDNMRHYEHALKVPYYLLFDPEDQVLLLYRHNGARYVASVPNIKGRLEIPELDLEVAILDQWVRFWHHGKLLKLPAELQRDLQKAAKVNAQLKAEAQAAGKRAEAADERAVAADQRAEAAERENAALRAQLAAANAKKNGKN